MPTDTLTPGTLGYVALGYASRHIKVFPLWHAVNGICQCKDGPACGNPGKHPRTRNGVTTASNREAQIETWWSMWPQANIGLPAGDNGLAVIDVDPRHGGDLALDKLVTWCHEKHRIDLMNTRVVRTGSGGLHLYYRQPPGGIKTAANTFGAPGLDTRGRGGYVISPPSRHANGQPYEVISGDTQLARWPAVLTPLMSPRPAPAPERRAALSAAGSQGAGTRWAQAALKDECDVLRALPLGEGHAKNQALNTAAYKLGRRVASGYLDEAGVVDALLDVARAWPGHGERELLATVRSGIQAGKGNPHPGPATRGAP